MRQGPTCVTRGPTFRRVLQGSYRGSYRGPTGGPTGVLQGSYRGPTMVVQTAEHYIGMHGSTDLDVCR